MTRIPTFNFSSPKAGPSRTPRDNHLLSPPAPPPLNRSRSSTISSVDDDDSSDDDSVLSWWSSGESEAELDAEKEAERTRREEERSKILSAAGLQIRRAPPDVPRQRQVSRRRRPAPSAPRKPNRHAPPVPSLEIPDISDQAPEKDLPTVPADAETATQDAYARYEAYLASTLTRPPSRPRADSTPRPSPAPISPQTTGPRLSLAPQHSGPRESRLSSLFKRIQAPSPIPDSPRKVISGPIGPIIRIAKEDGDDDEAGPVETSEFGKTWGSLVDASVLETMSDKERKRQEAIFEFIATEATYNRDLQLIVEASPSGAHERYVAEQQVFYASMMRSLDDKALTVIFANVEDILLFNTGFLSSLEQRQKACRLYIDVIGDVLEEHAPAMSVYTVSRDLPRPCLVEVS